MPATQASGPLPDKKGGEDRDMRKEERRLKNRRTDSGNLPPLNMIMAATRQNGQLTPPTTTLPDTSMGASHQNQIEPEKKNRRRRINGGLKVLTTPGDLGTSSPKVDLRWPHRAPDRRGQEGGGGVVAYYE